MNLGIVVKKKVNKDKVTFNFSDKPFEIKKIFRLLYAPDDGQLPHDQFSF